MNEAQQVVREAYDLARRSDHRRLRQLIADDATWHPAREGAWNP
jgi:ketosteroid isomerase-like protein